MSTIGPFTDYAAKLLSLNFQFELNGPWAVVGHTNREQGWKIHLSTVPVEAVRLLEAVSPLLSGRRVSFKIARDELTLHQLNEGALGATQVGKFLTVYPECDEECLFIAEALIDSTRGFHGPVVVTDLRLGDVVYSRYGPFSPDGIRDRLGNIYIGMRRPDGTLEQHQYATPFQFPDGVSNPFESLTALHETRDVSHQGRLFGPGYLMMQVIKANPKGSVFLALDMRRREDVSLRIIKEGRKYCCSDNAGRDIRNRLSWQAALLCEMKCILPVPHADPYFEVAGNGYLPIEYIEGHDLGEEVQGPFSALNLEAQQALLSKVLELVRIVRVLHSKGYVHRDLTPSNVRVSSEGTLYLLDLELAHRIGSPYPPFTQGTPGFMPPQQQEEITPAFEDDTYSLGALIIFLLTNIDPRRILFAADSLSTSRLRELTGAPGGLVSLLTRCVRKCPEMRPDLETLEVNLIEAVNRLKGGHVRKNVTEANDASVEKLKHQAKDLLPAAAQGLLKDVLTENGSGLWLSQSMAHSDISARTAPEYRLYRSANRGVAGVVYCLARLARYGYLPKGAKASIESAIDWLLMHAPTTDDQLPGLHFGEAGVAVAIAEAVRSGLIERGTWLDSYLAEALVGPLDWPDLTHGAAGQGIAAICCADLLGDQGLFKAARRCADFLIESQDAAGSWTMPAGAEGMSGGRFTGFAHGVAGIVYFLCEYASRSEDAEAMNAARAGAEWLVRQSRRFPDKQGLHWTTRDGGTEIWHWWCHGAPGVALAFLKLFERTKDVRYRPIATEALLGHPVEVRYSNLSQCHGLSGLGEIYLEAARVLSESRWTVRAARIANVLLQLSRKQMDSAVWLVEDAFNPTGDLMVGSAGIVHFLLRFGDNDPHLSFPLLVEPVETRKCRQ